ncbi:L-histidine N(alpha)-methyltransferase [Geomonas sp. RF6]|uniref:L-histidine N(alpha)-methyltransferase n=1 Tax=Geomonas sp. RF6 TaxID=2897342 RepID=UPI001E51A430|nr:L-histidine N(alpha)-methyltransferase [Geomonas sp. RF6]UFS69782.1 L-histidine N(alpha)-methyltransferase [Geomonas sp. RF6]
MNFPSEMQIAPLRRKFRKAALGSGVTILRGLSHSDPVLDFARAAAAGLKAPPYRLESRFLYDAQGSALFDLITQQPEYYLTRTESALLAAHSGGIRTRTGPVPLAELGSGSSVKTHHLLQAWLDSASASGRGTPVRYIPIDVSESALTSACQSIFASHPAVRVIGVNSEYHRAFPLFHELSPLLVLFLGSSIGNFPEEETAPFLATLADALSPGDFFLLGVDLVKDRATLEAAYNDAAGVTARFTRNIFARMNRELGSDIDVSAIEHIASYNELAEQVEIYARFTRRQRLHIAPMRTEITIEAGERIRTEISRKYRLETLLPYLERSGFSTVEVYSDERKWFALLLLRRNAQR